MNLLGGGDIRGWLMQILLSLPIVLIALCVHETAHGFIAYKLGDPTARNLGRLTLNPAKHLDPIGFICMLLFGFGWAKPVPINTRYFKNPKRDMAISALAGPVSNLLLAVVFALLMKLYFSFFALQISTEIQYFVYLFLLLGIRLNITLAVFNLIPIPPLDGSRILLLFLPTETYFKLMRYERYLSIGLMIALALGLLDYPIQFVSNLFMQLINNLIF
ncbi:MAG: site-2 protease family protein [Clostridia bacterium]|nr:site-2 protease family protein [Clostridia bacterium]